MLPRNKISYSPRIYSDFLCENLPSTLNSLKSCIAAVTGKNFKKFEYKKDQEIKFENHKNLIPYEFEKNSICYCFSSREIVLGEKFNGDYFEKNSGIKTLEEK